MTALEYLADVNRRLRLSDVGRLVSMVDTCLRWASYNHSITCDAVSGGIERCDCWVSALRAELDRHIGEGT